MFSCAGEVQKMSDRMQAAEAADIPIVSETFVEDAAAGCAELKLSNHKLATWGLKVGILAVIFSVECWQSKSSATQGVCRSYMLSSCPGVYIC